MATSTRSMLSTGHVAEAIRGSLTGLVWAEGSDELSVGTLSLENVTQPVGITKHGVRCPVRMPILEGPLPQARS